MINHSFNQVKRHLKLPKKLEAIFFLFQKLGKQFPLSGRNVYVYQNNNRKPKFYERFDKNVQEISEEEAGLVVTSKQFTRTLALPGI